LVHVEERDPAHLVAVAGEAMVVGRALAGEHRPRVHGDRAVLDERCERLQVLVLGGVVVEEEPVYPHDAVESHPLAQVVRLPSVDRADAEIVLAGVRHEVMDYRVAPKRAASKGVAWTSSRAPEPRSFTRTCSSS